MEKPTRPTAAFTFTLSAFLALLLSGVLPAAFGKSGGSSSNGGNSGTSSGTNGNGSGTGGNSTNTTKIAPPPVNYVDTMLQLYDANHDGQLEKDEFHQMWLNDREKGDEALKFDTDKNLMLDRDEIAAWREFVRIKLANAAKQAAAAAGGGS